NSACEVCVLGTDPLREAFLVDGQSLGEPTARSEPQCLWTGSFKQQLRVAFVSSAFAAGHFRDLKSDGGRQSAGAVSLKEVIGLEGVELGADGKTVSYTQFLWPTNALGARRGTIDSTSSFSHFRTLSHRSLSIGRASSTQGSLDTGSDLGDFVDYDPNLLDDPQWPCGKHKRVLIFPSYMTTVIAYVKPSDLKKDMNETFREKFPHIKLTLSKIRSLKREMRKLAQEDCGFEEPTVAMAFVYFEKLALKGKLNKQNRKLCAGACVLLAAKIGSDLRKHEVKHLIDVSGRGRGRLHRPTQCHCLSHGATEMPRGLLGGHPRASITHTGHWPRPPVASVASSSGEG
ncbi:CDK5 and ABL1 enzyme substrate 1, partial [Myotis lucifugus]|uniref:CDK5 and ABL1 enzyme substrate 1 n=1 Tax=Myotis lucifugus TaxID=59463 RepID=UPI000CCC294E